MEKKIAKKIACNLISEGKLSISNLMELLFLIRVKKDWTPVCVRAKQFRKKIIILKLSDQ